MKSYRPQKKFKNWIYKININLCRDFLKKRDKRTKEWIYHDNILVPSRNNPIPADFKDKLEQSLEILTPDERIVFILRDIEEMSIEESAQILNSSQAMVKYRLSKARRKLKVLLSKFYPQMEEK
jgi:RNA polymerase sigma-70 factor (ECF subfamily)